MSPTPVTNGPEHVDVLIVGAGISGIGAAHALTTQQPHKTFAILEARDTTGGTWDLFRYPGIRSDSDLHTFGYEFKPWQNEKAIAGADAILDYLRETASEYGIDTKIRLQHKVSRAAWSSAEGRWLVEIERTDTGEQLTISCGWLFCAGGYYRYDQGFTPQFEGRERFGGQIVHPQHWPEDLDYRGKRVVVIGSGATAVTLIPALATEAAHVTMLQRSPSYIMSLPSSDKIANTLPNAARRQAGLRDHPPEKHRQATGAVRVLQALPAHRTPADPPPDRQATAQGLSGRRALQAGLQPVGSAVVRGTGWRLIHGDPRRTRLGGYRPGRHLHRARHQTRVRA